MKIEVYSLGVILFKLLFKKYPFANINSQIDDKARDPDFIRDTVTQTRT